MSRWEQFAAEMKELYNHREGIMITTRPYPFDEVDKIIKLKPPSLEVSLESLGHSRKIEPPTVNVVLSVVHIGEVNQNNIIFRRKTKMDKMTMFDAQKLVHDTDKQYGWDSQSGLEALTLLVEEVGEVAREVRRNAGFRYGHNENVNFQVKKEEEIGDALYCIIKMANTYGVDIRVALEKVIAKVEERQANKDRVVNVEIVNHEARYVDEGSVLLEGKPWSEAMKIKEMLEVSGKVSVNIYG